MRPLTCSLIVAAVAFVGTLVLGSARPNAQPLLILEAAIVALMAWAVCFAIASTLEDYDRHNR